jgi:hypothetical protein
MSATAIPKSAKMDMNSSLPAHISKMYQAFNRAGISGVVRPADRPVLLPAETASKKDTEGWYP